MLRTTNKAVSSLMDKLIGSESEYSLENRFFNSICVLIFIMLIIFIPVDFVLGIHTMAWVFLGHFPLLCIIYYYALFKKKYEGSVVIVGILMQVVLVLNFFYNDGLQGPTILYFFLVASLTTTISNDRWKFIWLIVNLVTGLALISVYFYYPDSIKYSYNYVGYRMLDIGVSFTICMVLIYWNNKFILENYALQKKRAEDRTEQLLDQSEKLKTLHTEKDRLFSIVSHDFRGPLASIENGLEVLHNIDLSEDEKLQLVGQLLAQVKITSGMLENILHWSKNQMKVTEPTFQKVNVRQAIEKAKESLHLIIDQKEIVIHNEISPTEYIQTDIELLQVVLRNLISNAVKFSPIGSEVKINGYNVQDFFELEIKDQGIGMSEEQIDRIFSFRAQSTYGTANEKGMGLGLFLTNELVQKIGGKIKVNSSIDKGTIFKVHLPIM